ncbi:MAG TPA: hypothetical protein DCY20_10595 [Firmicutes bacterium]|nr:hypothetical protein [Bacillota bacterium]
MTVGGGDANQALQIADFAISLITYEEYCVDDSMERTRCHQITDVQNGDILISKSSHTLLYRHGHAGIVVDAANGLVLEAIGYGTPSLIQPLDKWNYFPTVKVLRLKDADEAVGDEIAQIALTKYQGITYDILAHRQDVDSTHCSDIVWKVFNEFGYDLDSTGGIFVSPQDISKSEYLEEVMSFGFSNTRPW